MYRLFLGWRVASASYVTRIKTAIGRMLAAVPGILPLNRVGLDWYFLDDWHRVFAATAGFQEWYGREVVLEGHFQNFIKYEEERIRGNLEKIKYNIDTPETVSLVVGAGRLEKVSGHTCAFSEEADKGNPCTYPVVPSPPLSGPRTRFAPLPGRDKHRNWEPVDKQADYDTEHLPRV